MRRGNRAWAWSYRGGGENWSGTSGKTKFEGHLFTHYFEEPQCQCVPGRMCVINLTSQQDSCLTRSGYLALVVSPPVHQSPSVQPLNYSILLRVVVSFTFVMVSCGLFKTRQDMNHVYSINVNSHPLRIGGELEWVGLRI